MFKRELAQVYAAQEDPFKAVHLMKEIVYENIQCTGDRETASKEEFALVKE